MRTWLSVIIGLIDGRCANSSGNVGCRRYVSSFVSNIIFKGTIKHACTAVRYSIDHMCDLCYSAKKCSLLRHLQMCVWSGGGGGGGGVGG